MRDVTRDDAKDNSVHGNLQPPSSPAPDTPTVASARVDRQHETDGDMPTQAFRTPQGMVVERPQQIGEYELLGEIARGGMGVAFQPATQAVESYCRPQGYPIG